MIVGGDGDQVMANSGDCGCQIRIVIGDNVGWSSDDGGNKGTTVLNMSEIWMSES